MVLDEDDKQMFLPKAIMDQVQVFFYIFFVKQLCIYIFVYIFFRICNQMFVYVLLLYLFRPKKMKMNMKINTKIRIRILNFPPKINRQDTTTKENSSMDSTMIRIGMIFLPDFLIILIKIFIIWLDIMEILLIRVNRTKTNLQITQ